MQAFTDLFLALDRTTRTSRKVEALEEYFRSVPPADAAWALWFLSGQRLKRAVKTGHLRQWVAEMADLPLWLVEESYDTAGDLAETLALLLPAPSRSVSWSLSELVDQRLLPLTGMPETGQRDLLRATWSELSGTQRFLWNKLITGGFRVGVSRGLVVRALARLARVEPSVMEHRLMGEWRPHPEDFARLLSGEADGDEAARPYPFYLASPLEGEVAQLGEVTDWQLEWKWDGIRVQLIRRCDQVVLWSRGEEVISPGYPELMEVAQVLPNGTVLDGELLAWQGDAPLAFGQLQRRLNRRAVSPALRREVPVVFMAYDLLESEGTDWRHRPLTDRRGVMNDIIDRAVQAMASSGLAGPSQWVQDDLFEKVEVPVLPAPLRLSPVLSVQSWKDVALLQAQARAQGTEGIMLKKRDAPYGVGRQRGAWWKWKVAPLTCDAVLVAAQPGHGRRATLFTDYTFAVWNDQELVPVAKAYSGLTDREIDQVDAFVRANTTGRFGPLRTVKPELVFELAFEGITSSTRHKSGLALRFPRIARQRSDKKPGEADTVDNLQRLTLTPPAS